MDCFGIEKFLLVPFSTLQYQLTQLAGDVEKNVGKDSRTLRVFDAIDVHVDKGNVTLEVKTVCILTDWLIHYCTLV